MTGRGKGGKRRPSRDVSTYHLSKMRQRRLSESQIFSLLGQAQRYAKPYKGSGARFRPVTESGGMTDVRFTKLNYFNTPHPIHRRLPTYRPSVTPLNQGILPKPAGQQDNFIGVVVGVSVGGLVVLALLAVVFVLCRRRRGGKDIPDLGTKGTVFPPRATFPPRNAGTKRWIKAGEDSAPKYFEPVYDSVYCKPEEVA